MNTLQIEADLAKLYEYNSLPDAESKKYRTLYRKNIPDFLSESGDNKTLYTLKGTPVCNGYDKIVVGDYGAFVEFSSEQRASTFVIKQGEEYRVTDKKYRDHVKYVWKTIRDDSNVKIYQQKKTVSYADYVPGKYYVSVHEVTI